MSHKTYTQQERAEMLNYRGRTNLTKNKNNSCFRPVRTAEERAMNRDKYGNVINQ
jgi:hypothetical protein